ncbi:MAG: MFS transporter [Actinobacteria bacterium]|nr:MFS transporter [Actinomycetota bacterium]
MRLRRALDPLLPIDRFTAGDRRIVITIWMAGLIQGFAQSQASASLPFTRAGLGLSEGEMSLLLGFARLAAFAALPLGWLGDHIGRRRPFLVAVTLMVLGGSIAGLAADAVQFGVSHAVLRTGTAAVSGLALVILAETASVAIRAYAMSFYGAAVSFGSGLALMALPLAEGGPDAWRVPHLLIAAGLLLIPLLVRRVPETKVFHHRPEGGHWRELVRGEWSDRFWIVVSIGFLASAFGAFAAAFSTERLITQVGLDTGSTVLTLLAGGTLGAVGFFVGGRLADTWGRRPTTVLSLLLAVSGGTVAYSVDNVPMVVAGLVVSSFGTFALVPSAGSHRAELFPTGLRSSATTAVANFTLAGSAFGLIVGIFTIDTLGLTTTVLLLGIGMLLAALLTLRLPETKGQDLTAISVDRR